MRKSIVKLAVVVAMIFVLTANGAKALEYDVFTLAKNGTPEQILIALRDGANFNVSRSFYNYETEEEGYTEEFENDETPLHLAAMYNHNAESIRLLLESGLAVNEIATSGNTIMETPLSCAVRNKNLPAVEELLRFGANPHVWSSGCKNSMFHIIASEYIGIKTVRTFVNALLKAGGNINFHQEITREELRELMKYTYHFDETCQETVSQELITFFEDMIRNASFISGGSYKLSNICARVLEAYYSIPAEIREQTLTSLDKHLLKILADFEGKYPF